MFAPQLLAVLRGDIWCADAHPTLFRLLFRSLFTIIIAKARRCTQIRRSVFDGFDAADDRLSEGLKHCHCAQCARVALKLKAHIPSIYFIANGVHFEDALCERTRFDRKNVDPSSKWHRRRKTDDVVHSETERAVRPRIQHVLGAKWKRCVDEGESEQLSCRKRLNGAEFAFLRLRH